ncbi:MAG: Gfo/Idh/MocA family oxidoreductase [Variovorax sp.]
MLKVALIGAGGIAPAHVEGFLQFQGQAQISAVANRSIGRAQQLIERYQLDAQAFPDYREAIVGAAIVVICTPPASHLEIATAALREGAHVLVEKPMAPTLADCDAMLQAARAANKTLAIVAQSRFIDSIHRAATLIRSGHYGNIRYAQVNSFWWRGANYHDLSWRGRWATEGGGCTMNQAIHHVDLLLWFKGLPAEVTAVMGNLAHDNSEEEDISLALLRYPDGSFGQLNCGLFHHGEPQLLNFQLEQIGVSLPFAVAASRQRSNGFPLQDEATEQRFLAEYAALPSLQHEHHAGQIGNFLQAIAHGTPTLVDGVSGRAALELISAVYKSAATGKTVQLPLARDDPFYAAEGGTLHFPRYHKKHREVDAFEDMAITSFKGKF